MPVSFNVADHPAEPVTLTHAEIGGLTPEQLLAQACSHQYRFAGNILRSSFNDAAESPLASMDKPKLSKRLSKLNPFSKSKPAATIPLAGGMSQISPVLTPTPNGFVHTVITAYNKHHNLIIRPDDVWIIILTQFNFFVNANAELLRASFVAHEGKKELTVQQEAPKYAMDFALMARQMVDLLAEVVVDPTLRAWVMPNFSTTTLKDQTVGAIVMMATLKSYFEYVFESIECGIPRVTLDGTKADWETILGRLEKLKEYGIQTTAWYHLLVPVISRFVVAFDSPDKSANVDFWQTVAHFVPGGSGPSFYSGWISAFCAFNEEGKWIGLPLKENVPQASAPPDSLSAKDFWATYGDTKHYYFTHHSKFSLDDTPFHMVECNNIPSSYVEVPVKLKEEGSDEVEDAKMLAGVVGTLASDSGAVGTRDSVQPVTGWWMYLTRESPRPYGSG
ncbi:hypothetical protein MVEN_01743100 [Mycena venus]|uniref:Uncharacterized protein n=1 Tax=Mycena venus TaxID=2733690 RepID=A0A8H6XLB6_9AGAR|nr:hypothetical protein MVEN_01743100 [Mycena venus]